MNQTDRPPGCNAPPCVGRQRQRPAHLARLHVDLGGQPKLDGALVEHQRLHDDVVGGGADRRWPRDTKTAGGEQDRSRTRESHGRNLARALALSAVAAAAIAGCHEDIADLDGAFYNGDGRLVHCGVNLDTSANTSIESIDSGLDRARDRAEVLELYTHHPGVSVPLDKIEHVLAGARDRGLAFVTYGDFANGTYATPGLALSFDDTFVDSWLALLPMFEQYGARVTFFVSRYDNLGDEAHAGLKQLQAAGHDIEAHSVLHLRAPDYVEEHGIQAYLDNELDPSIAVLRRDGFDVQAFAYPFGARTGELDRAIGKRVPVIRSVAFAYTVIQSPCPR